MSYTPTTDMLALLRRTNGGVRSAEMPGLDYIVVALARAGLITLSVGQTAPTSNQTSTAWFQPAFPNSWAVEGALFLWNANTSEYEPATPALWYALLAASGPAASVVQDVAVAGPTGILANAGIVRVMNVGALVTLVLPLASFKTSPVLVSDWANLAGTNNILVNLSGGDVLPNGATSWTLAGDGASAFFRPVPGGYAL